MALDDYYYGGVIVHRRVDMFQLLSIFCFVFLPPIKFIKVQTIWFHNLLVVRTDTLHSAICAIFNILSAACISGETMKEY